MFSVSVPLHRPRRVLARGLASPLRALILVSAVYLVTLALLPLHGIWINDNGNRLILLQGIIASNYRDYSIPWAGSAVDPSLSHAPISSPFGVVRDGRLFSLYSPVFPTVASPFFRLLGWPGLYVLPLAASVVMLAGLAKLMDTLEAGGRAKTYAILIAGLATPIWFYSETFWEHTLAVCLVVWALVFVMRFLREASSGGGLRRDLLTGAALLALAIYFRDDLYSMLAALLVVLLFRAPQSRLKAAALFLAATIAALLPLWLFQWKAVGAPFGLHLQTLLFTTAGIARHVLDRPAVFYNLYVGSSPVVWQSLLLTAPFWLTFGLNPRLRERSARLAVAIYGWLALAVALLVYGRFVHAARPIAWMGWTSSLFPASPVLIFAFVRFADRGAASDPGGRLRSLLWQICLIYAVIYGLASPKAASWGIHWGNRLVLALYPLLAALAAANLAAWQDLALRPAAAIARVTPVTPVAPAAPEETWAAGQAARISAVSRIVRLAPVALVVLASFAAQLYSITILGRKMDFSDRLNRAIAAAPEQVIVTDQWWLGQELYTQFTRKLIFRIQSQPDLDRLTALLADRGYTRMLYVSPPMAGEQVGPEVREISDGGLNYWNLRFFPVDLRPN